LFLEPEASTKQQPAIHKKAFPLGKAISQNKRAPVAIDSALYTNTVFFSLFRYDIIIPKPL